jgi:AAA15 family ATPase/GTPase
MELKPITLISGENNTGKTSILESVFLFHDYLNPDVFIKLLNFRGMHTLSRSPHTIWEPLFHKMDAEKPLLIKLDDTCSLRLVRNNDYTLPTNMPNELKSRLVSSSTNYSLSCVFMKDKKQFEGDYLISDNISLLKHKDTEQPDKTSFIQYIGPNVPLSDISVAEWFGKVELMGKKQQIIDCLRILDDNINDVSTIVIDGYVQLYITLNNNTKYPLHIMGDGMRKIMNVALTLLANPSCMLLLDEIENGLHYSMHKKFWALLAVLAKQAKCQILATTHSYECISSALDGVKSEGASDIFAYTRLERDENGVCPKTFTCDMLEFALSSDLEVR